MFAWVVHALPVVLAAAVAAALTGARRAAAVVGWAADAPQHVLAELGVFRDPFTGVHRAPDESTFRRILAGVDADALDDTVGRWVLTCRPAGHPRPPPRQEPELRRMKVAPCWRAD
ncbi:transposase family protein [Micromonospora thermarum]|uniref:transposase family protein n=1 Tax=Micromonospora thermarum TaxID=2720024 RepID=UPI002814CF88|nr:transposase family protein [Micromonospora thermarum]